MIELASLVQNNGKLKSGENSKENDQVKLLENHRRGQEPVYARWTESEKGDNPKRVKMINPVKLLEDLDACLPENSIIVADGGDFVGTAAKFFSQNPFGMA